MKCKELSGVLLLVAASVAYSATIDIPADYTTIQGGLNAAQTGDTILVAPGTYIENITFLGKDVVLLSELGPDSTIIDGSEPISPFEGSVVRFENNEGPDTIVEGFTLTGGSGYWDNQTGYQYGGGIYCLEASPTIRGNIITGNSVDGYQAYGGGIYLEGSQSLIEENLISDNTCSGNYCEGGGISSRIGSPLISSNLLHQNYCNSNNFAHGGGLACDSTTVVTGNTFTDNSFGSIWVGRGGGVRTFGEEVLITGNTFTGNYAYTGGAVFGGGLIENNLITDNGCKLKGGGICCYSSENVEIEIRNNIISDNTSGWGGGGVAAAAVIENNIITGNSATYSYGGLGAGIYWSADSGSTYGHIINNSIANNHVTCWRDDAGAGIFFWQGGSPSSYITIRNNILWGNLAGTQRSEIALYEHNTSFASIDYCDIDGGIGSVYWTSPSVLIWGDNNIDSLPEFVPGPLSNYHLDEFAPSPCIDAGDTAPEFNDPEDPLNPGYAAWPALGTIRNDMGAYGGNGAGIWTGIESGPDPHAGDIRELLRVFPNPCRDIAFAAFELNAAAAVSVCIYDLSGRVVSILSDAELEAGPHSLRLETDGLSTGVYFVTMDSGGEIRTSRLVVLK